MRSSLASAMLSVFSPWRGSLNFTVIRVPSPKPVIERTRPAPNLGESGGESGESGDIHRSVIDVCWIVRFLLTHGPTCTHSNTGHQSGDIHRSLIDAGWLSGSFLRMARLVRIVIPGMPHHVTQRGNRRQEVFFSDEDREEYLRYRTIDIRSPLEVRYGEEE